MQIPRLDVRWERESNEMLTKNEDSSSKPSLTKSEKLCLLPLNVSKEMWKQNDEVRKSRLDMRRAIFCRNWQKTTFHLRKNHYKYKISSSLTFKVPTESWNQTSRERTFWLDVDRDRWMRWCRKQIFHLEKKTEHTKTSAFLYFKIPRGLRKQADSNRVRRFHEDEEGVKRSWRNTTFYLHEDHFIYEN